MATFEISSVYEVPIDIAKNGAKSLDVEAIKNLASGEPIFESKGIYVFSVRAGRGVKPLYIGKTERQNFLKEAFGYRNRDALAKVINNQKGTLLIQFITQVRSRGKPNLNQIGEIEYFLIGHAAERNSDLLNINGISKPNWVIKGVYNQGRGKPTKEQQEFRRLFGLG